MSVRKMSIVLVAVALVCGLSGLAQAAKVKVGFGPNQGSGGGEFTITVLDGPLKDVYGLQSFKSFCIEKNEYVGNNATYNYVINSGAVAGGRTGGNPDPVSDDTAYLFYNFWEGSLSGVGGAFEYNYSSTSSANDLQQAIWFEEGELPNTAFASLRDGAKSYLLQAAASGFVNNGRVSVLNLTDSSGGLHQDQLVVTIPVPGALWLGMGLVGCIGLVGGVRRRFQAK
jgi:hypothetical protein